MFGLGGAALLIAGFAGTAMALRRRRQSRDTVAYEMAAYEDAAPLAPAAAPVYAEPAPVPPAVPAMARSHGEPTADLDAMIAAPPSPENPFLTHAKRRRRAMALLREREADLAETSSLPSAPAMATADIPADRSQTVYSFGKAGGRRKDWVPGIG